MILQQFKVRKYVVNDRYPDSTSVSLNVNNSNTLMWHELLIKCCCASIH